MALPGATCETVMPAERLEDVAVTVLPLDDTVTPAVPLGALFPWRPAGRNETVKVVLDEVEPGALTADGVKVPVQPLTVVVVVTPLLLVELLVQLTPATVMELAVDSPVGICPELVSVGEVLLLQAVACEVFAVVWQFRVSVRVTVNTALLPLPLTLQVPLEMVQAFVSLATYFLAVNVPVEVVDGVPLV